MTDYDTIGGIFSFGAGGAFGLKAGTFGCVGSAVWMRGSDSRVSSKELGGNVGPARK